MSKSATISIGITGSGDGASFSFAAPPTTNTNASGMQQQVALTSGNNAITCPLPSAKGVLVVPPTTSAVAKTVKGVNGDTGFALSPNEVSYFGLPTGTTGIIIGAASAEVVMLVWV